MAVLFSRRQAVMMGLGLAATVPATAFADTIAKLGYKADGTAYEGLVTVEGKTYLYEGGVKFQGGRKEYKGARYFYKSDGHMAVSETVEWDDGTEHEYGSDGVLVDQLADGWYRFVLADADMALDVTGNAGLVGTNVELWTPNESSAQSLYVQHVGNSGAFRLVHTSGRVLARESATDGANVSLAVSSDSELQYWVADVNGDGCVIHPVNDSAQSLCSIDATQDGANVLCSSVARSYATWNMTQVDAPGLIDGGWYIVMNAASGQVLDVNDAKVGDSIALIAWDMNNNMNQSFRLSGSSLLTFCDKAVDVNGASAAEGAVVQQFTVNNGVAQQFEFVRNGLMWNIVNKATGNYVAQTGNSIDMRAKSGTSEQDWYFIGVQAPSVPESAKLALHYGDWDYTDWDFVEQMRQRAIANGGDAEWYATNSCDEPCRDVFFKKIDGVWRPVAAFYSVPGHLTDQGHCVSWKGIWQIEHRNVALGRRNYVTCYMICNPVGDHDCQAYHDGWTRGQSGYQYGGCNGLSTEHAKWIYDNVPDGCKVDVCGNCTDTSESPTGDYTKVQTMDIVDPFYL